MADTRSRFVKWLEDLWNGEIKGGLWNSIVDARVRNANLDRDLIDSLTRVGVRTRVGTSKQKHRYGQAQREQGVGDPHRGVDRGALFHHDRENGRHRSLEVEQERKVRNGEGTIT